jgi:plastocyanin
MLTAAPAVAAPDRVRGLSATAASVARVRIVDDRFRPRTITVSRGTLVRWVNRGNHTHTVTSSPGLWDSGLLSSGTSFSRRFRRRGTFRYFCRVHPTMTGTIVVG